MGEIISQIPNLISEDSKISRTCSDISCVVHELMMTSSSSSSSSEIRGRRNSLLSEPPSSSSSSSSSSMTNKPPLLPPRIIPNSSTKLVQDQHTDNNLDNKSKDDHISMEVDDNNNNNRINGGSSARVALLAPKRTFSTSLLEVSKGINALKSSARPLWGLTSFRGRRAEMEDYAIAVPQFLKIPSLMLRDGALFQDLTAHLFAVYDGHGGFQVADYCREHLHLALAEEIEQNADIERSSLKDLWEKVFLKCFRRMDDEVGGFERVVDGEYVPQNPPVAPDSVGSTAVVVIVCPTHIIVANCGDSRAVLNHGKVPMALSVDHKPNREDEHERIEAAGGRIINWDGCRVSGILAVSRSIGDRLLRPYVIADPEVMLVPRSRQDECLIIASDGLWDVMSQEEACDLARRRLLVWHKKYSTADHQIHSSIEGGKDDDDDNDGIDPASQDASDYLSRVAFQRGSLDNISVIVVDLKPHRKFKKKI